MTEGRIAARGTTPDVQEDVQDLKDTLPWPKTVQRPCLAHDLDWFKDAGCQGRGGLFFSEAPAAVAKAQGICRPCRVVDLCSPHATCGRGRGLGPGDRSSSSHLATAPRKR